MKHNSSRAYSKRCLISHRPPFRTEEPVFFRCPNCHAVTVHLVPRTVPVRDATTPAPAGNVPSADGNAMPQVICCGKHLHPLSVKYGTEIPANHAIRFTVFGGFEENAVRITVDDGAHPMTLEHRIEWMYYQTFQGGQMKYLPQGGRSVATFSFADEDAYVYCDRDVCRMGREHCQFSCKRGNAVYMYCNLHGLMRLELDGF